MQKLFFESIIQRNDYELRLSINYTHLILRVLCVIHFHIDGVVLCVCVDDRGKIKLFHKLAIPEVKTSFIYFIGGYNYIVIG